MGRLLIHGQESLWRPLETTLPKLVGMMEFTSGILDRLLSGPRGLRMHTKYTAVVKKDGDWWIGWIEEVPGVNCQEHTNEDLLESLRITLKEALGFNRPDALAAAGSAFQEVTIGV